MQAKNPRTGALITGTLEVLQGNAGIADDSFRRMPDGRIEFESSGSTKIDWDSSDGRTEGRRVYIDENDEHVPEAEIVLVQEATQTATGQPDQEPHAS